MSIRPDTLLGLLAHPLRLRAALLLRSEGELCVCELTHAFRIQQPVVSRHLGQLRRAGLVTARREGTWIHYRLAGNLPTWVTRVLDATASAEAQHARDLRALATMRDRPGHACCPTRTDSEQATAVTADLFAGEHP